MDYPDEITGIILAGGQSRRMKTEKGLVLFNNKPLIQYAIEALKPLCNIIHISAQSDVYESFGYAVIHDEFRKIGPMGGVHSGLKASATEMNVILSCDMPYITTEMMHWMIDHFDTACKIAVPWHKEKQYEPMCGVYRQSVLPEMESFIRSGNHKLPDFYQEIPFQAFSARSILNRYSPNAFYNINSPADIAAAPNM